MLKRCMGKIKRDGYTFHSFLESDGYAYIDTGYLITTQNRNNIRIETDGYFGTSNDTYGWSLDGTAYPNILCYVGITKDNRLAYGTSNDIITTYTDTDRFISHLYIIDYKNGILKRDDQIITTFTDKSFGSFTRSHNLFIFKWDVTRGTSVNARKNRFKIYNDDVLVMNLIPASRDYDGVCGMYDLVTDTFLTNANTVGTFTVGEEKDFYEWKEIKEIKRLKTPRLPKEYQEVEYIESTGTQWIDTGINVTPNDKIQFQLYFGVFKTSARNTYFLGTDSTTFNNSRWNYGVKAANTMIFAWGNYYDDTVRQPYNTKLFLNTFETNGEQHYSINGRVINTTYNQNWDYFKSNIKLFGLVFDDSTFYGSYVRFYDLLITINSSLTYHLIPCYRKSDGVIGMYDIINNVFHTNQGTGTFLKGEDVKFDTIKKINKVVEGEIKTIYLNG